MSGDQVLNIQDGPTCFVAGTLIDMADGSRKAIEQIEPDDLVLAYDEAQQGGRGELVPSRVVQTFTNQAPAILDFHGLKVTPGHVTLCGDGPFAGQHRPLIDIVLDDGAIVDRDGELIRASSGSASALFSQFQDRAKSVWSDEYTRCKKCGVFLGQDKSDGLDVNSHRPTYPQFFCGN